MLEAADTEAAGQILAGFPLVEARLISTESRTPGVTPNRPEGGACARPVRPDRKAQVDGGKPAVERSRFPGSRAGATDLRLSSGVHRNRTSQTGRPLLIAAGAPLDGLDRWARGDLLEIVLLVLGAILLTRLAEWTRNLVVTRIDQNARETDELVRSEAAKHRHVVAQVVTWAFLAVVYLVAAVLVVQRLGIPLAGLVAPAALLSAALGFGLQRFVQDIGAGFFITAEHQYGFGNVVRISVTGVSGRPSARSRTSPSG